MAGCLQLPFQRDHKILQAALCSRCPDGRNGRWSCGWQCHFCIRWYGCQRPPLPIRCITVITHCLGVGLKASGRAANLAVTAFTIMSIGQYAWCQSKRKEEARGIAMAVVGMKKLEEKRQRERKEAGPEATTTTAVTVGEEQRNKPKQSWKFW
jgi:hypothetical protein